jgi:hypothetical protein
MLILLCKDSNAHFPFVLSIALLSVCPFLSFTTYLSVFVSYTYIPTYKTRKHMQFLDCLSLQGKNEGEILIAKKIGHHSLPMVDL